MAKFLSVEASACSKCHWTITCCSLFVFPDPVVTVPEVVAVHNWCTHVQQKSRTRIAQCQSWECDGNVAVSSTRISSHVFGALERLKRLTFLPCRMSTVQCPLPAARWPACRCACVGAARVLGKRAHKSHALTLVQNVVSLWLGSTRSDPNPDPCTCRTAAG